MRVYAQNFLILLTFGRAEQSPAPTNFIVKSFYYTKFAPVLVCTGAFFLFVGVGGGYGGSHLVVAVVGHDQVIIFIPVDIVFVAQAFFV